MVASEKLQATRLLIQTGCILFVLGGSYLAGSPAETEHGRDTRFEILKPYQPYLEAVITELSKVLWLWSEGFKWVANKMTPIEGTRHIRYRQVANAIYMFDLTVYVLYSTIHKACVKRNHKKFDAHRTNKSLLIHVLSGMLETSLGWYCFCRPDLVWPRQLCALTALLFQIPTNLTLTLGTWGLKYITVTGYVMVALLRAGKAFMVLSDPTLAAHEDLWLLLHTAMLVRACSFLVVPFTSADRGVKGDLSTEPVVYTLSLFISVLTILPLVFPPWANLVVVLVMGIMRKVAPPRVYRRIMPQLKDVADMAASGARSSDRIHCSEKVAAAA